MSLIRKHVAVLQAWACLALVPHDSTRVMLWYGWVMPVYVVHPSVCLFVRLFGVTYVL